MKRGIVLTNVIWTVAAGAITLLASIAMANSRATTDKVNTVSDAQNQTASTLRALCTDYGQTVSRLDQNLQAIGKALKVNVVVGKVDSDPCKQI